MDQGHQLIPDIDTPDVVYRCTAHDPYYGSIWYHHGESKCWQCGSELNLTVDIADIYTQLPHTERVLRKNLERYNGNLRRSGYSIHLRYGAKHEYEICHTGSSDFLGAAIYDKGKKTCLGLLNK